MGGPVLVSLAILPSLPYLKELVLAAGNLTSWPGQGPHWGTGRIHISVHRAPRSQASRSPPPQAPLLPHHQS